VIRDETAGDAPAVRLVNEEAFGSLTTPTGPVRGYGLAPMAVRTDWQRRGVRCQWPDVADDAFIMLLVLDPERAASLGGVAHYRPEFDVAV
jgi:predicted N-acetyltransferase YhbS